MRPVFFSTLTEVRVVPKTGGAATVLAGGQRLVRGLALDASTAYWVDCGGPTANGGSIRAVPKTGGQVVTVVGPLRQPVVLAVDDHSVYWMAESEGDVWAAPKSGGAPAKLAMEPEPGACLESRWMMADSSGLVWLRSTDPVSEPSGGGQLWRLSLAAP
jgi:hypothetical protein